MTTVLTEGVFDLLHANHLRFLAEARAMGTRLIVMVTSDDDVASYKRRPVLCAEERMETVRATGLADLVLPGPPLKDDYLTEEFLDALGVDLVVYAGEGWDDMFRVPIARGIMRRLPYREGINTSTIIAQIKARDDL